jgi:hypothetical protein
MQVSTALNGTCYGSEGWGFESLRAHKTCLDQLECGSRDREAVNRVLRRIGCSLDAQAVADLGERARSGSCRFSTALVQHLTVGRRSRGGQSGEQRVVVPAGRDQDAADGEQWALRVGGLAGELERGAVAGGL